MTEDEQLNLLLAGGTTVVSTANANRWDGVAKGRALRTRPRGKAINSWVASADFSMRHQARMYEFMNDLNKGRQAYFPMVTFPCSAEGITEPKVIPVKVSTPAILVCRSCGGIHGTDGGFDARSWLAKSKTDETLLDVDYGAPRHYFIQVGFPTAADVPAFPITVLNSHDLPELTDPLSGLTWFGFIQSKSCAGVGETVKAHYLSLPNLVTGRHPVPWIEVKPTPPTAEAIGDKVSKMAQRAAQADEAGGVISRKAGREAGRKARKGKKATK